MTSELIAETDIVRDKDYLYYCGTNDKGFITLNRAKLSRRGSKKKETEKNE